MRVSQTMFVGPLTAALVVSVAACGGHPSPPAAKSTTAVPASSSSAPAQPSDYTALLIKARDIDAPMPFVAGPATSNPNGQPGAAITFSSQPHPEDQSGITVKDVQIVDTIHVLSDPAAAASALNSAKSGQALVKDPKTDSADVGTGGTLLSGTSPDGSKSVTALLFTEGRGFVTLEFVGGVDSPPPPPDFVIDVGHKQDAAVKKGLGG
ncbi:hypothetical protein PT015_22940 [Candidatus Mycobacterium wuenschmannii]|uniref:Lipoprotein LpqN n=1 Tax=Candidatus Mycobacterium wuenschmannii TaxID=3027808 RepID=A0ABY8VXB4_9MYCO|nr:hypothetical protein [Candidatus Mycobacterium wuenschmannii]WIM87655.1 hypothetical protein PT015_22940 [Candidatus Mycobacterium wuenschmannii]